MDKNTKYRLLEASLLSFFFIVIFSLVDERISTLPQIITKFLLGFLSVISIEFLFKKKNFYEIKQKHTTKEKIIQEKPKTEKNEQPKIKRLSYTKR